MSTGEREPLRAAPFEEDRRGALARWTRSLLSPVLGPLLRQPWPTRALAAAAVAQVGLVAAGWPAWSCPLHAATGWACPGCGLSRACVAAVRLDWRSVLELNPAAPLVAPAVVLVLVGAVLPTSSRERLAAWTERLERRTGLAALALIVLFGQWLARASWP